MSLDLLILLFFCLFVFKSFVPYVSKVVEFCKLETSKASFHVVFVWQNNTLEIDNLEITRTAAIITIDFVTYFKRIGCSNQSSKML